jgi:hypothetical protein
MMSPARLRMVPRCGPQGVRACGPSKGPLRYTKQGVLPCGPLEVLPRGYPSSSTAAGIVTDPVGSPPQRSAYRDSADHIDARVRLPLIGARGEQPTRCRQPDQQPQPPTRPPGLNLNHRGAPARPTANRADASDASRPSGVSGRVTP